MSEEKREMLNKEFDEIDTDKSGFIEYKEVKAFLTQLINAIDPSIEVPEDAVKNWIEELDTNHDGKVSRDEFIDFALKFM